MNAKISFCVEAIIYLLLYDLHDCTFNHKLAPPKHHILKTILIIQQNMKARGLQKPNFPTL